MGRSEMFKKFLCQKTVLDTLRVYLDISQPFLDDLIQKGIIDKDDLHLLQTLGWPSNRNQLMQILIKRQWSKNEFTQFCELLEKTQEADLVKTINKKAEEYFKDTGIELGGKVETQKDPMVNLLDDILMGLSVKDQNKIRRLLMNKDEQIRKMKEEEDKLENTIQDLTSDNSDLHMRLHSLEKAAETLVHGLEFGDRDPQTIEEGIALVKGLLEKLQAKIKELDEKLQAKSLQYIDQKEWTSELTTEVIELKKVKENLETELEGLKQKYATETFEMSTKIEEIEGIKDKQERKIAALQKYYQVEITDRDDEIEHLKRECEIAEKMKITADSSKEAMEEEMITLRDKIRKLLASLGLDNEVKNLDTSLDFARDIGMTKRKVSRISSKPVLNPIPSPKQAEITDEDLFDQVNLPWGNTPQDIQRRRESVSIEAMFPLSSSVSIEFAGNASAAPAAAAGGNFTTPRRNRLPPLGEH